MFHISKPLAITLFVFFIIFLILIVIWYKKGVFVSEGERRRRNFLEREKQYLKDVVNLVIFNVRITIIDCPSCPKQKWLQKYRGTCYDIRVVRECGCIVEVTVPDIPEIEYIRYNRLHNVIKMLTDTFSYTCHIKLGVIKPLYFYWLKERRVINYHPSSILSISDSERPDETTV